MGAGVQRRQAELTDIDKSMDTYAIEYRVDLLRWSLISMGDRYESYSTEMSSNNWKLSSKVETLVDMLFVRASVGRVSRPSCTNYTRCIR